MISARAWIFAIFFSFLPQMSNVLLIWPGPTQPTGKLPKPAGLLNFLAGKFDSAKV